MSNTATIKVALKIDDQGVVRGFKDISTASEKAGTQGGKAFDSMGGSVKATTAMLKQMSVVAAGLSVGVGIMVKQSIDAVAEIDRLSTMAGVSAEAFQELSFAGAQYQINQDALTDGMKELSLRGDEFVKTGAGPAKESFERLGYSADDLNKLLDDTPALLSDIISRMEGLDKAAQIRIADEIFGGTGGEQFVAMIQGGANALDTMRKSARDLGVVVDNDMVKQSVEAKKQVGQLTSIISAQFNSAVADLAPEIVGVAQKTTEWIKANRNLINQGMKTVVGEIGDAFDFVASAVDKTNTAFKRLIDLYNKLPKPLLGKFIDLQYAPGKDINELINSINDGSLGNVVVTKPINTQTPGYDHYVDSFSNEKKIRSTRSNIVAGTTDKSAIKTINRQIAALQLQSETYGMTASEVGLYKLEIQGATSKQLALAESLYETIEAGEKHNQRMIEGGQVTVNMRTPTEELAAEIAHLNELLNVGAINADIYGRAVAKAQEKIAGSSVDNALDSFFSDIDKETDRLASSDYWSNFLESMENNMMNMDELVGSTLEGWSGQFGDFFADAVLQSDSLGDAFSTLATGMATTMVSAIGQMLAQWLVYQATKAMVDKSIATSAAISMTANAEAASLQAGINAYSSAAAIPITGWAMAPAAMAAALAVTTPMAASIAALAGSAAVGQAHDGIDSVPASGTWLLERGERVTTQNTSAKLDAVLSDLQSKLSGGTGSTVVQSNPKIINVWDEAMISDHISSGRADSVIINRIKKNASTIKNFLN